MQDYANVELEKKVLSYFIRKDTTLDLKVEFFTNEEVRKLFSFCQRYKRPPSDSLDDWWSLWKIDLERTSSMKRNNGMDLSLYKKFLQTLFLYEVEDDKIDFFLDQIKGFAEARQLFLVYKNSIDQFDQGNTQQARQILEDGLSQLSVVSDQTVDRGDFLESFENRFQLYEKKRKGEYLSRIPTGIEKLDKRITGVARSSLNLFQGQTGIGKTFLLQEIAWQGMIRGMKVLFVTVEMQRYEIETRWDSRLSQIKTKNIDVGNLDQRQVRWWKQKVDEIRKSYKQGGRLATVNIPEGCSVNSIEKEMDFWEERWRREGQKDHKTDLLVIDYGDLMVSSRRSWSEQEGQGNVFRDLKRLSQARHTITWTATQISGSGYGKSRLKIGDTGYSKKKAHWTNLSIGIGGNDNDVEDGILRLFVNKNTFGPKNFEVILYPDFEKATIDIEKEDKTDHD